MKFSIKYLWKYVKANLFTSLILIDTRSNLDPTFLDKFQSLKSSNEVRIEFLVKIKTPAMTSKMHLAPFSLAKNFLQSYQGI